MKTRVLRPDCFDCSRLSGCIGRLPTKAYGRATERATEQLAATREADIPDHARQYLKANRPRYIGGVPITYEPRIDGPPFCFRERVGKARIEGGVFPISNATDYRF